ncbi:nitroreductase family deazaflavin-dependent oxidoreductase [Mycobacterium sp. UM_CSW]|uniref:nitroreductase family deazaflavin-dependent oxidoreductase n=1 Tax=Mycobacterium sp. UM_CSW TaxID=1370119 RepID=UPI0004179BD1|nr:nitroreductase family deazaflavin-dependent oxidoreductase [Mycobacterium sp. UM_CSW]
MSKPRAELPAAMLRFSKVPAALLRAGIPLGPLYLLESRGRRSGTLHSVPVVVFRHDDGRWLVSMYGETGWVANVRDAGTAVIRRGRRAETIHCTEVTDNRRAEVAMHLRRKFGFIPFVRAAFNANPSDGPGAFQAEQRRHPAFLIARE